MKLIVELAQQTGLVIAIMACAAGGTIVIAELINHFITGKSSSENRKNRYRKIKMK